MRPISSTGTSLGDPIVVEFPLRGEWTAVHSPAQRVPSHGTDLFAQTYAYDLIRLDPSRKNTFHRSSQLRYWTLGISLAACYGYGDPVHAVFDGTIVRASAGTADRRYLQPIVDLVKVVWASIAFSFLGRRDPWEFIGNHVLIRSDHDEGVHAMYAHLAHASVPVAVGDHVKAGDRIGRVGHNGNSTAPHLHCQLMDSPDPATASGLACAFRRYEKRDGDAWTSVEGGFPPADRPVRSIPTDMTASPAA